MWEGFRQVLESNQSRLEDFTPKERKEPFFSWLMVSKVPEELSRFLAESVPENHIRFKSGGYIYEDHGIMDVNEEYKKMMESGYIQIGHAPNGDQIVVDIKKGIEGEYTSPRFLD